MVRLPNCRLHRRVLADLDRPAGKGDTPSLRSWPVVRLAKAIIMRRREFITLRGSGVFLFLCVSARCPSKWGAADERGSGNHMKPANVLRAAQLIKTGEPFELSHVLGRDMPLNPGRQYDVHT